MFDKRVELSTCNFSGELCDVCLILAVVDVCAGVSIAVPLQRCLVVKREDCHQAA